jgi:gamma-glutamylcysteine synthetase
MSIANYDETILKSFFKDALFEYQVYKKIKKEIDKYLSTDFNFIELISPDENKVSDLLKVLLEPNGVHGQGEAFFKLFIDKLIQYSKQEININNYKEVSINREKVINSGRRIDILIEANNFAFAIENKIDAPEQPNQLDDYFEYLEKNYKNFILIFLTVTRRKPESFTKDSNKFINVSYNDLLIPWLYECHKNCESQKVKFFIKDFINWTKTNFKERIDNE